VGLLTSGLEIYIQKPLRRYFEATYFILCGVMRFSDEGENRMSQGCQRGPTSFHPPHTQKYWSKSKCSFMCPSAMVVATEWLKRVILLLLRNSHTPNGMWVVGCGLWVVTTHNPQPHSPLPLLAEISETPYQWPGNTRESRAKYSRSAGTVNSGFRFGADSDGMTLSIIRV
jgi:hypothetical protein